MVTLPKETSIENSDVRVGKKRVFSPLKIIVYFKMKNAFGEAYVKNKRFPSRRKKPFNLFTCAHFTRNEMFSFHCFID